jgi:hypothetical protein
METMVTYVRQLTLKQMQPIAKEMTPIEIRKYGIEFTDDEKDHLTLGEYLTDDFGIFELYLSGERPVDAKVISRTYVDRITGDVARIELNPKNEIQF